MAMTKPGRAQFLRQITVRKVRTYAGLPDPSIQKHDRLINIQHDATIDKLDPKAYRPALGTFQQMVNSLSALDGIFLSGFQMKLLKQATAVLADAIVGPHAAPSLRLLVRRTMRVAVLAAYAATHIARIGTLTGSLADSDSAQAVGNIAELLCIFNCLYLPAPFPSSPLLLRALSSASTFASEGLSLRAVVEGMSQLDSNHSDLVANVEEVLGLASSSVGILESGKEVVNVSRELLAKKPKAMLEDTNISGSGRDGDGSNCRNH